MIPGNQLNDPAAVLGDKKSISRKSRFLTQNFATVLYCRSLKIAYNFSLSLGTDLVPCTLLGATYLLG
jgi:hypothetical protein